MNRKCRPSWRANWNRAFPIATCFAGLATIWPWLLPGCAPLGPKEIVYVPDTDRVFAVSPGDRLVTADGNEVAIPYQGLILSAQRYIEILKGVESP